jgi:hypothetical protein
MRGEPRLDAGEAEKGFVKVVGGVGRGYMPFGERLLSLALMGVNPPECMDAGVRSCVLLDFTFSTRGPRGPGEPLRSTAGDLGGTSGGNPWSSPEVTVFTFSSGFGVAVGLGIGESGFPGPFSTSEEMSGFCACVCAADGPVTHDTIASPKGPNRQFVPGALHDLS